jgi:hypothetical protein
MRGGWKLRRQLLMRPCDCVYLRWRCVYLRGSFGRTCGRTCWVTKPRAFDSVRALVVFCHCQFEHPRGRNLACRHLVLVLALLASFCRRPRTGWSKWGSGPFLFAL